MNMAIAGLENNTFYCHLAKHGATLSEPERALFEMLLGFLF